MSPQPWPDQGADALSLTLDAADLFSGIDVSSRPPSCVMANCLQPLLASGDFKAKEIHPPPFFFIKPWISLGFSTLRACIWKRKPASTWFLFRKKLDRRNVPSRLPVGPKRQLGWVSSTVRTPLPKDSLVLLLIYFLLAASSMEMGVQLPRSLPQQSQVHSASCSFLAQTQTPNTKFSF